MLVALTSPASGQGFLEQFSYEGLGLSGIGVELGQVWSDRVTPEPSPALRVDYGLIAPRARILLGVSYFRGALNDGEIDAFETGIRRVVADPTGDAVVDVGDINWSNLEASLDLQYLVPAGRALAALGLGLAVHVRNGSGPAIDGTFVEDALDTIVAGAVASLGIEVPLWRRLHATADVRGGLTSELRTFSLRGGVMYRIRPWTLP